MNYPQQRRAELWFAFAVSAVLGGLFCWLAITRDLIFLWWFSGPFLVLMPLTAWKAARPNSVFESELENFDAFNKRHPILSWLLILGAIAGCLWTLGSLIFRILANLP